MLFDSLPNILLRIPIVLMAIVLHELGHAYVSYRLGDPTAKLSGRLTLNPLTHIDPFGGLLFVLTGFGWAKPVPIDPRYYKNLKAGCTLVSLAGPLSNLLQAFVYIFIYGLGVRFSLFNSPFSMTLITFLQLGCVTNVNFAVFNLLPIPPLDGSKILNAILPTRLYLKILRFERYGMLLILILMMTGVLSSTIGRLGNMVLVSMAEIISKILWLR